METILSDDNFKNSTVVLCGHSLGGAIASIVAIRLQQEKVINSVHAFINHSYVLKKFIDNSEAKILYLYALY